MSLISPKDLETLGQPIPAWAVKKHPTKTYLSVIHPMAVIDRLNQVFGVGEWQFTTEFIKCDPVTQGTRTAYMSAVKGTLLIPKTDTRLEQYGGSTNEDYGDALKGGATDALTKIASYLGIGASIYKGQGNGEHTEDEPPTEPDEETVVEFNL